jgi:hypothetical protein
MQPEVPAMTAFEKPFYPIIYVRGFAGGQDAIEETVSDPYMGFNLGAAKCHQTWTGKIERLYFESPLIRLMKDFGYRDVYFNGSEMGRDELKSARSVFIFRYYDMDSRELMDRSDGKRSSIEEYAVELDKFIGNVKENLCGADAQAQAAFRVYLVAHSMGGLICRCFLQNPKIGDANLKKAVDKVFTYATPHNGIDFRLVGNVPSFLGVSDVNNFNRQRMKEYLALPASDDVSSLNGHFDPDRFFCLVGTDYRDYPAAMGLSKDAVGPTSDGLVLIKNASVWGPVVEAGKTIEKNSPRAFVYNSHSGPYGIVNSESGYQNLSRFLFGDLRVDGILEIEDVTLPAAVEAKRKAGSAVRASYHIEAIVMVRGARWELHRRKMDDSSAIFRTYDSLFKPGDDAEPRHPQLFSAFLSLKARVNPDRDSLGFAIDLRVLVPEYEIDKKLWLDDHYEGGYVFRDKINLEAIPVKAGPAEPDWILRYGFDSLAPNQTQADRVAKSALVPEGVAFTIPLDSKTSPGLKGKLLLKASKWA